MGWYPIHNPFSSRNANSVGLSNIGRFSREPHSDLDVLYSQLKGQGMKLAIRPNATMMTSSAIAVAVCLGVKSEIFDKMYTMVGVVTSHWI